MMSPIKLILVGLLVLISACSESANQGKPLDVSSHAIKPSESVSAFTFFKSADESESAIARCIAGLAPYQRPENAPTIREFTLSDQLRKQWLTGVSEPIPVSLEFIEDQGAWYTPFNHPGMQGYYDLRNWHDNARGSTHARQ